jgi:3-isopropylmalate/(R)-2-methylmalate dehydratase small subunit
VDKLERITSVAAPLLRANIDTDVIIPGHQLMKLSKTGFGEGLFYHWRFREDGTEDPEFVLNREPYRHARILLAEHNFACGSSREVAVWALRDFGFRCVIAPSFGAIFYANCFKNAFLPVVLPQPAVDTLARQTLQSEGRAVTTVDLVARQVVAPGGETFAFEVADLYRTMLLEGLAPITATLRFAREIEAYRSEDAKRRPWIYADGRP